MNGKRNLRTEKRERGRRKREGRKKRKNGDQDMIFWGNQKNHFFFTLLFHSFPSSFFLSSFFFIFSSPLWSSLALLVSTFYYPRMTIEITFFIIIFSFPHFSLSLSLYPFSFFLFSLSLQLILIQKVINYEFLRHDFLVTRYFFEKFHCGRRERIKKEKKIGEEGEKEESFPWENFFMNWLQSFLGVVISECVTSH